MAGTLANRSCLLHLERVDLNSLEFILPTLTLATLNVAVIGGNLLVVAAVVTSHKLRTVTNTFIVSLAVADLLVGILVLPFSNANEVSIRFHTNINIYEKYSPLTRLLQILRNHAAETASIFCSPLRKLHVF